MRSLVVLLAAAVGAILSLGWMHHREQALSPPIETGEHASLLAVHEADLLFFAAPGCPFSAQAREHLQRAGASFVELELDAALAANLGFVDADGRPMAPALLDRERRLVGYHAGRYDQFLRQPAAR